MLLHMVQMVSVVLLFNQQLAIGAKLIMFHRSAPHVSAPHQKIPTVLTWLWDFVLQSLNCINLLTML